MSQTSAVSFWYWDKSQNAVWDGNPDALNGLGDINKTKVTSFVFRLAIVSKAKLKMDVLLPKPNQTIVAKLKLLVAKS